MRNVWIVAFLLVTSTAWAQPVVGVVGALVGTASADRSGGDSALHGGQELHEGWTVITGANSRLRIDLRDGTALTLGAASSLRLEHLEAPDNLGPTRLTKLVGFLRALVTPRRGRATLEISSDEVVASVRGTAWVEHATATDTEVFVAAGHVALRGAGGGVTLGHGLGVTYHLAAPHSPVTRWPVDKIADFDAAPRLP